jgi:hypothetical protein
MDKLQHTVIPGNFGKKEKKEMETLRHVSVHSLYDRAYNIYIYLFSLTTL